MKILFMPLLICLSCTVVAPALVADEPDSIDALRAEIRALKLRVTQLEAQVQRLSRPDAKPVVTILRIDQGKEPLRMREQRWIPGRPASIPSVEEVMRLQIESPGSLLNGIHERERVLRHRPFYPEIIAP